MKHFFRTLTSVATFIAIASASTAAHALPTLYTKNLQNVYLNDSLPGFNNSTTLDTFAISGQRFNLYLTFNIVNDVDLPGFSSLVTFQTVTANKQFDFLFPFSPYSVSNSGGLITAVWNNLAAGTYDVDVTYAGNVFGTGDANLNGTLTATAVPEPATLALGAAALLVGVGSRRLRRDAA